jgi:hypothetical protein
MGRRRGLTRSPCLGLLLAALLGPAAPARAQSADEIRIARETADHALEAYHEADYERALGLFAQAKAIYPSAQIVRIFGYTHLALGHWQPALDALEEALASKISPLSEEDRRDVREQLDKVLTHFGEVLLTAQAKEATLRMNGGAPMPMPLPKPLRLLEGMYTFTVEANGSPTVSEEFKVEGGKTRILALDPPAPGEPPRPQRRGTVAAAPPPPKPSMWAAIQRPLGYGLSGTGLGLGAVALATGLSALSLRGKVVADVDAHQRSFGDGCARGDVRLCTFDIAVINYDADRADALRNLTIGLGTGAAVLAGGGAALLLWSGNGSGSGNGNGSGNGSGSERRGGRGEKARAEEARDGEARGTGAFGLRCGPYGLIGVSCVGAF